MKIIIWGHKLHSHTHSYIHYGFYRAFKSLGYDTYWYDNDDNVSGINFDNSIFFTEGQVDKKIPINKTCKYILHNCRGELYADISTTNKINIQFFHKEVLDRNLTKLNDYTFVGGDIIHQPWATDLLPEEIDLNDASNEINNRECVWVGTYNIGDKTTYENNTELDPFFNQCRRNNIVVKHINPWVKPISPEENKRLINNAFIAPAINGIFQKNTYYIPCRIFKNISYGHMGITNNIYVNQIFDNKLVYDSNASDLFTKAINKKNDKNIIEEIKFLMNEVKNKHTFINRANVILDCILQRK